MRMYRLPMQRSATTIFAGVLILLLLAVNASAQSAWGEAPMLSERVANGELPPVEERMPVEPLVVPVVERIGEYGGTWRSGLVGGADVAWFYRTLSYEGLLRWDVHWTEVIPNVARSVTVNDDSSEFTFHLREGMRWSNGQPFTADDILFWYEDVILNEELTPAGPPSWMVIEEQPGIVEKLDDHTVRFAFAAPHGLFLQLMATPLGNAHLVPQYPRHYLGEFHPNHNADGIEALVAEYGVADWVALFQNKASLWFNAELPRIHGWVMTNAYGVGTRVVAERNPYYWKVDPEGNQLPYLDQAIYSQFEDREVLLLSAMAGEIDMQDRHISAPANRAVLTDHMESGGFRFFARIPDSSAGMSLSLNLNHTDPVKREIFRNKDFRIGLSHAIDRQEIIDLIHVGQGEPYQVAPRPESPLYHERLARQYTEHDVSLANEHLDRAGYSERDSAGYRLGPDGRRISFTVEVHTGQVSWIDSAELIRNHLREVGIDMNVRSMDRSLFETRREANQHDAAIWAGEGGLSVILRKDWYFPGGEESRNFAPLWYYWYIGDPRGEEPPAEVKRQMELFGQLESTADPDRQAELMTEILDIAADQFYTMGISLETPGFGIVRNNFRNVPDSMPGSWTYPTPGPSNPVQYFIDTQASQ